MLDQLALLKHTPWNVLVIMDALRADSIKWGMPYFSHTETVRSPAWITYLWIAEFVRAFGDREMLFFSANPVVDRELAQRQHAFTVVPVWRDWWRRHGPHRLPTVHPEAVNHMVQRYLRTYGQPERMVVWFLQPHVPYVGERSIPYSGWGGGMDDGLSKAAEALLPVEEALERELTNLAEVRACYEANVSVALEGAGRLAKNLAGRIVMTSDHGELLGEDGRYGHRQDHPKLHEVPWLAAWGGEFRPRPIVPPSNGPISDNDLNDRLRSLGYQ